MIDYIKVKATCKLLLLTILLFSIAIEAAEPPLLRPKNRSKEAVADDTLGQFQLDLMALTPLGKEDFYEKRFSTFGGGVLFSIPISRMSDFAQLYGTIGFVSTVSRLTLNQGENAFTSVYFQFPLLVKASILMTSELTLDLFVGLALRTTRYDSRSTTDGGLQKADRSQLFLPEAGAGLKYTLTPNVSIKIIVSYLHLAIGTAFLL